MLETKTIELKREYTDDIKYAIVAFANTAGGKIYIGLNDDGSVLSLIHILAACCCWAAPRRRCRAIMK